MPLRDRLERLILSRLLGLVCALSLAFTLAVELCRDKTSDREQLGFFVEDKVLLAIKMDGKSGDAEDGAFDLNQLLLEAAIAGLDHHTTSNAEVAVEPSVPQTTTIGLDTHL